MSIWIPLESDPRLMEEFLEDLGIYFKNTYYNFHDVCSFNFGDARRARILLVCNWS